MVVKKNAKAEDKRLVYLPLKPTLPGTARCDRIENKGGAILAYSGSTTWKYIKKIGWTMLWSQSSWIEWLKRSNARVRFHSNKTVEIAINNRRSRQATLQQACEILYARIHREAKTQD